MNRRNFLGGLLAGVSAGGLVIAARETDVVEFASVVTPTTPLIVSPMAQWTLLPGETLYDKWGQAVAVISGITVTNNPIEVPSFADTNPIFLPGLTRIKISADGIH